MKNKICDGYIYCISNIIDGMQYIGQTGRNVNERWDEHLRDYKKLDTKLYQAMRDYGVDSFKFEIVDIIFASSEEERDRLLNEMEIYYISKYNTYYNGYNMTLGGDHTPFYLSRIPVIQYDLKCNELNRFDSIAEASRKTSVNHSDISSCCKKDGKIYSAGGYIWRYENDPLTSREKSKLVSRYDRRIDQYDYDGNYVATHENIYAAATSLGDYTDSNATNISKSCNSKWGCCGYIWRYHSDPFDKYEIPKHNPKIQQRTIGSGELIQTFSSIIEAHNKTGCNAASISACCQGRNRSCGGYIWCFEGDLYNPLVQAKEKSVDMYSLEKQYICSFTSIKLASEETNVSYTSIASVCQNKYKTAGGYIWRYTIDDISSYKYDPLNKKKPVRTAKLKWDMPVEKRDKYTGELLDTYSNIYVAGRSNSLSPSNILNCCREISNYVTIGGFYWCFVDSFSETRFKLISSKIYDAYSLDGEFVKTVNTDELCDFLNNNDSNVHHLVKENALGNTYYAYGYVWRFHGEPYESKKIQGYTVSMYDLYGNLLKHFRSVYEASRFTGFTSDVIYSAMTRKGSTNNRYFTKYGEPLDIKETIHKKLFQMIDPKNGRVEKEFMSQKEINDYFGIKDCHHSISDAAKNGNVYRGYMWKILEITPHGKE